jgi:hypothetical protein
MSERLEGPLVYIVWTVVEELSPGKVDLEPNEFEKESNV